MLCIHLEFNCDCRRPLHCDRVSVALQPMDNETCGRYRDYIRLDIGRDYRRNTRVLEQLGHIDRMRVRRSAATVVHGWHRNARVLTDLAVHADAVLAHMAWGIQACETVARKHHRTARWRTFRLEKRPGEFKTSEDGCCVGRCICPMSSSLSFFILLGLIWFLNVLGACERRQEVKGSPECWRRRVWMRLTINENGDDGEADALGCCQWTRTNNSWLLNNK